MRNIALHVVYQGTDFHGYQIQPQKRTVQSCLLEALGKLLGETPALVCAGRTDAGVHAYAQVVNFHTEHGLPVERFARALSHMLPRDLSVIQAWEQPLDFSSRFGARGRHYRYVLQTSPEPNPLLRDQIWAYEQTVDLKLLQTAWASLQGSHDFRAFCRQGSYRTNFQIPVYWTRCWQHEQLLVLEIMGQSFLYNMVRTLVGTALEIARGHLPADTFAQAIARGDRSLVGRTAPPQGLYLFNVIYPPESGIQLIRTGLQNWPAPLAAPAQTAIELLTHAL